MTVAAAAGGCVEIMIAQKKSMVNSKVESEGGWRVCCVCGVEEWFALDEDHRSICYRARQKVRRAPSQRSLCEHG
jgi:hypothetical protein